MTNAKAHVEKLLGAVKWVQDTQKRFYGNATDLHIEMTEFPRKFNQLIATIEAELSAEETSGDPAFRKTAWNLKELLRLPMAERDEILRKAAEQGAHLYARKE